MKESMPTEYYLQRVNDLPRKRSKTNTHKKNQDLMFKLFTPYELFVGSVNLLKIFLNQ